MDGTSLGKLGTKDNNNENKGILPENLALKYMYYPNYIPPFYFVIIFIFLPSSLSPLPKIFFYFTFQSCSTKEMK